MSIYRDKKTGRWRFDFDHYIEYQRIRRRQLLPPGWTRSQAEAFDRKESSALHSLARGIAKPRHSIDEAVAYYLRERAPSLKSVATVRNELAALHDWYTGRVIDDLPEVCSEYAEDQKGALAPATIRNRISYLRAACRHGWKRHKLCDHDPGARVSVPQVNNERQVYVDRRQMLQLARACRHWETRALIRIAFYSGMRLGEIIAAEVVDGWFVLPDSKNGDPVRVPVHRRVRCLVDYVWPTRFIVSYHFRAARSAVGMDHLHFHDLRHSTASELLSGGASLGVVGKVLRHRSPASTARYSHLHDAAFLDAIESIGKKAKSPPPSKPSNPSAGPLLPMEARAGVEPTYTDLQPSTRALCANG